MKSVFKRIEFPELVIGLVAPIGTDITITQASLKNYLEDAKYKVEEIQVTDLYKDFTPIIKPIPPLRTSPLLKRYDTYIKYGNRIRKRTSNDSALAVATIREIMRRRLDYSQNVTERFSKVAYIIRQFKRKEEVDLMRSVYGRIFFQISVYSRRGVRVDNLSRRFAEDKKIGDRRPFIAKAEKLVQRDEEEVNSLHGQRVGKVFHDADFVVNADIFDNPAEKQVQRFLDLLFSANYVTPTKAEYGMYAAKSAALRTSDLSRQVGAAIFSKNAEIISLGSNEVPKAGGGTYWPEDGYDAREFRFKHDSNDRRKRELLDEILKIVNRPIKKLKASKRLQLLDSGFMDALEYGRVIHAEMSAIVDGARNKGRMKDSVMYVTTFPCHMCAKHIVASGIEEVVFLEPYPKSLASRLHQDSITFENADRGLYSNFGSVRFTHFFGITPRRYRELFERAKRKNKNGDFEPFISGKKRPNIDLKSPFYAQLEDTVISDAIEVISNMIK